MMTKNVKTCRSIDYTKEHCCAIYTVMILIVHFVGYDRNQYKMHSSCIKINDTDNSKTYRQQVVEMQRSVQTKRCDHHDERVREIGTIRKSTEREQCPKGEKSVYNTCADKAQSVLAQTFHRPCTEMLTTPRAALCGILPSDWNAASATTNM
jgi:hypothetical protein